MFIKSSYIVSTEREDGSALARDAGGGGDDDDGGGGRRRGGASLLSVADSTRSKRTFKNVR